MASLSSYEKPGSVPMEGKRVLEDMKAGAEAMRLISEPMEREQKRDRSWKPRKVFLMGNHENRCDRAAAADAKLAGLISTELLDIRDWERHAFLEVVTIDGIKYSHYFQNQHSGRPIGGTVQNRLSKIGDSFVSGHEQGYDIGTKNWATGRRSTGIVAGSCYLHEEPYRGNQGQRHFRGAFVLHEVAGGEFCEMPVTLSYLCRKYEKQELSAYMARKYPYQSDWQHLREAA